MARKSLMSEISVSEMLHYREEGYSNQEIADFLGLSYQTVLKYIGKQPKKIKVIEIDVREDDDSLILSKDLKEVGREVIFDSPLFSYKVIKHEECLAILDHENKSELFRIHSSHIDYFISNLLDLKSIYLKNS